MGKGRFISGFALIYVFLKQPYRDCNCPHMCYTCILSPLLGLAHCLLSLCYGITSVNYWVGRLAAGLGGSCSSMACGRAVLSRPAFGIRDGYWHLRQFTLSSLKGTFSCSITFIRLPQFSPSLGSCSLRPSSLLIIMVSTIFLLPL